MRGFFWVIIILIFTNTILISKMSDTLVVYKYSESRTYIDDEDITLDIYVTLDLKQQRYQILQVTSLEGDGQLHLVSQGIFMINQKKFHFIDKVNSISFFGNIKKGSLIFNSGVKFLRNKKFIEIDELAGIWYGVVIFYDWDEIDDDDDENKQSPENITLGTYSTEYLGDHDNGLVLELKHNKYDYYRLDSDGFKLDISSGVWHQEQNILELIDDDNNNIIKMKILDNEKIISIYRIPFFDGITPLKLKLSHYEDGKK